SIIFETRLISLNFELQLDRVVVLPTNSVPSLSFIRVPASFDPVEVHPANAINAKAPHLFRAIISL
ncbi:hypothetical protein, partial [Brucella sp.]|uniref:hypothetical protein n=1 Tax=Brucella sp. TaxID=52132 RepID=UPI0028A105B5